MYHSVHISLRAREQLVWIHYTLEVLYPHGIMSFYISLLHGENPQSHRAPKSEMLDERAYPPPQTLSKDLMIWVSFAGAHFDQPTFDLELLYAYIHILIPDVFVLLVLLRAFLVPWIAHLYYLLFIFLD